jgi:aminoglycoside phosphotransferase (APT) family kinase protein
MAMAVEQGWQRRFAFVSLSPDEVSALIGEPVLELQPLSGGLRNTNYRVVRAAQPEPVVLRIHTADPAGCRREQRLLDLVEGSVPVPHVVRAAPDAQPAWSLMTFVQGERFDRVLPGATRAEVKRLAESAGAALASIHRFTFPRAGFLDDDLRVTESLGPEYGWRAMVEDSLSGERLAGRIDPELLRRLRQLVADNAWRADQMSAGGPCLSHSDFKPWNMLVRDGRVVAVLDWEFAFAGAPLNDIGNFLRYSARQVPEYESGFVDGYRRAGGTLPDDWKRLSRLVDLINLCVFLNRPDDDLAVANDVRPLLQATLEACA